MPGIGVFELRVLGVQQVKLGISRMLQAVDDMRPYWPAFRIAFQQSEREQFGSQGGAGRSGRWAALSEPYATRKRARWGDRPILQASGALVESMTGDTALTINETEPMFAAFGSATEYGVFHQTGTSNMPAREPISVSAVQESAYFGRAIGYMARELGNTWRGR